MKKIEHSKFVLPLAIVVLVASAITGVVGIAHADTSATAPTEQNNAQGVRGTPPAAVGVVSAVSGTVITLTDKKTNTTYTIDAATATITKHTKPATQGAAPTNTTITASQISVGDMIAVQGTVSGSTITATKIEDGLGGRMGGFGGHGGMGGSGVRGMVTAVNGSTITVTGMDGKSYTVDASNSTAGKFETIPVSSIQVGDSIGIQGSVNGTSVTAKSIMDGVPSQKTAAASS
jgi:hypothetical protein